MAANRLIGAYPVIAIRHTIDGRQGYMKVRESMEGQGAREISIENIDRLISMRKRYGQPAGAPVIKNTVNRGKRDAKRNTPYIISRTVKDIM